MNASCAWPAPAKLNLLLRVVGRRPDGYHLLQTVFQFLDHGDSLDFEVRLDGRIHRAQGPTEVPEDRDLVVRAARLLQERSGVRLGASIHLRKTLPLGGGLGGGSSDAATTLVALNRLWGIRYDRTRLMALGAELGADVPVFVGGEAAWAEGIGEQLAPVDLLEPWYLVVEPGCRVATREIFQAPELTRNSAPITIARFRAGETRNDLLPVVVRRYPEVAAALDWLRGFGEARLTGSGACVFAEFEDERAARRLLMELPRGCKGFVARGCNRSPLLMRLAEEGA